MKALERTVGADKVEDGQYLIIVTEINIDSSGLSNDFSQNVRLTAEQGYLLESICTERCNYYWEGHLSVFLAPSAESNFMCGLMIIIWIVHKLQVHDLR